MPTLIWKLQNVIKDYAWGSKNALSELFSINNPQAKPQAEIWMGAHPAGSSTVRLDSGEMVSLAQLIQAEPQKLLGESVAQQFHTLPYLFKVLAADKPLSIQVHPNKQQAEAGFEKENQAGLALDDPQRNYKDPNHKPELVYALTPFLAMNGFRPLAEIQQLLQQFKLSSLQDCLQSFQQAPSSASLQQLFYQLLTLDENSKQQAIAELIHQAQQQSEQFVAKTILQLAEYYPHDAGLFAPLLLNVIELQPGQAMFLKAQTPHAYLHGVALEIMASSDNVLRAGLTNKHLDIEALIQTTNFTPIAPEQLLTQPQTDHHQQIFPVPCADFRFAILANQSDYQSMPIQAPEIVLCLSGHATIAQGEHKLNLKPGESVFIAAAAGSYQYQGEGTLARAYI